MRKKRIIVVKMMIIEFREESFSHSLVSKDSSNRTKLCFLSLMRLVGFFSLHLSDLLWFLCSFYHQMWTNSSKKWHSFFRGFDIMTKRNLLSQTWQILKDWYWPENLSKQCLKEIFINKKMLFFDSTRRINVIFL